MVYCCTDGLYTDNRKRYHFISINLLFAHGDWDKLKVYGNHNWEKRVL